MLDVLIKRRVRKEAPTEERSCKDRERTQTRKREDKSKTKASEETKPADMLILDSELPDLWEN